MKAKDYYEKYGEAILNEALRDDGSIEHLTDLVGGFLRETKDIIAIRRLKKDRSVVAVIKEQNEKWNALCAIFQKELGQEVLRRNGFMAYMKQEIPELEKEA